MEASSLIINYSTEAESGSEDLLLLEQEEWEDNAGIITQTEMLRYISAYVYQQTYGSLTKCGMVDDGELIVLINVYPFIKGMPYQLHTSYGSLSKARGGRAQITETIDFQLTTEERVKYPCWHIDGVSWLGECYDQTGAIVPNPELTFSGDTVSTASAVYGTVEVTYTTEKYTHTLRIPKRDGAIEEYFSAVVYALYLGGIVWHEVDMPNDFDEENSVEHCGIDGSVSVEWPEGDPRPISDEPYHRHTVIDYCAQNILIDEIR